MLAPQITEDIGETLRRLELLGYSVVDSRYDDAHFGNWYVDLEGARSVRIVKDRGQFMANGNREELERHDLWRAYDRKEEFEANLLNWASIV
jgi:hypothetical protein